MQPEARVEFDLLTWGKVQLALSGGTQQMNVLAEESAGHRRSLREECRRRGRRCRAARPTRSIVLTADQLALYNVGRHCGG